MSESFSHAVFARTVFARTVFVEITQSFHLDLRPDKSRENE